jgi:hypothetical protein
MRLSASANFRQYILHAVPQTDHERATARAAPPDLGLFTQYCREADPESVVSSYSAGAVDTPLNPGRAAPDC